MRRAKMLAVAALAALTLTGCPSGGSEAPVRGGYDPSADMIAPEYLPGQDY